MFFVSFEGVLTFVLSLACAMIKFVADRMWNASLGNSTSKESKALEDMTSLAVSSFTGFCLTRLLNHLFDERKSTFTFLIVKFCSRSFPLFNLTSQSFVR